MSNLSKIVTQLSPSANLRLMSCQTSDADFVVKNLLLGLLSHVVATKVLLYDTTVRDS